MVVFPISLPQSRMITQSDIIAMPPRLPYGDATHSRFASGNTVCKPSSSLIPQLAATAAEDTPYLIII